MAGYGFGICGHKNEYSSGVLCGNWAQDQKYQDVCAVSSPRSKAIAPSEKILNNSAPRHGVQFLSGKEIARKNKMSLSYSSLFGHTGPSFSSRCESDRFLTENQKSYGRPTFPLQRKPGDDDLIIGNVKYEGEQNIKSDEDKQDISCDKVHTKIPDFRRRKVQINMSSGRILH